MEVVGGIMSVEVVLSLRYSVPSLSPMGYWMASFFIRGPGSRLFTVLKGEYEGIISCHHLLMNMRVSFQVGNMFMHRGNP